MTARTAGPLTGLLSLPVVAAAAALVGRTDGFVLVSGDVVAFYDEAPPFDYGDGETAVAVVTVDDGEPSIVKGEAAPVEEGDCYEWSPNRGRRDAKAVGEHVVGIKLTMSERTRCDRACAQRTANGDWHVQAWADGELLGEWWTGPRRNAKIRSRP